MTKSSESSRGIHRLLTLARCPRRYGYRYVLKLVPKETSEALRLGNAVHAGLEAYYSAPKEDRADVETFVKLGGYDRAQEVLARYFERYRSEDLHVVSVEREYAIKIEDPEGWLSPLRFTRRGDLGVEMNGRLYLYDHKTASDPGKRERTSEIDPALISQDVVGREVAKREHGLQWGGVVLNVIPTAAGSYGWKFSRVFLTFSERRVTEMKASLYRLLRQEIDLSGSPWNYTQHWDCVSRYGTCDYLELCNGGPDAVGAYEIQGTGQ